MKTGSSSLSRAPRRTICSPGGRPSYPLLNTGWLVFVAIVASSAFSGTSRAQVDLILRTADGETGLAETLFQSGPAKMSEAALANSTGTLRLTNNMDSAPLQRVFLLAYVDSAAAMLASERWRADSRVEYVQWNHQYSLNTHPSVVAHNRRWRPGATMQSADPLADSLDHFPVVGVDEAWRVTRGSSSIRVGVVDTGVFFDHPDLVGQFAVNDSEDINGNGMLDPLDLNGIDDDNNGFIDDISGFDFVDRPRNVEEGDYRARDGLPYDEGDGHGTNVAGVIAARADNSLGITGVAPGIQLVIIRAFGADGRGDDDDISAAIVYAADNGVSVLNLSFGDSYYSPLMHESIRYATAKGVVVVASAGNAGGDDPHYPSDYPEVISTVWLDARGNGPAGRATFGAGVDVGAPGTGVYTTLLPADSTDESDSNLYGRRSGSSMASPMVAAAAALVRSVDPSLTPDAVRAILETTATDIGDDGWDHRTGAGRINIGAAVVSAMPTRVSLETPSIDEGYVSGEVQLVATVVNPYLRSFSLYYAQGDEDLLESSFTRIAGPIREQAVRDTVAVWDVSGLADGTYTLRLAVETDRGPIEDRRRVVVDRTAPVALQIEIQPALYAGRPGVFVDATTDDETTAILYISSGNQIWSASSDRMARRHGITWTNTTDSEATFSARLVLTNRSGLKTIYDTSVTLPVTNLMPVSHTGTGVPHGYLLPTLTDLDGDSLPEIIFNKYEDGWLGDTLNVSEFAAGEFRTVGQIIANVFPRDIGDTDSDGLLELLGQVGPATILLEQDGVTALPVTPVFVDTTGLTDQGSSSAVWGARLADLDHDGSGEIVSHNTSVFRILESNGSTYRVAATLANSTGVSGELGSNSYQQPEALIGDFDNDGKSDILVGDSDGDWQIYEERGDDAFSLVWTLETSRYNAGTRFAKGDLDGDGTEELVLSTTNWIAERADGYYEPGMTRLYIVENLGDDQYSVVDSLAFPGEITQHDGLAAADLDGDGRAEIITVSAPDLYVLNHGPSGFEVRYHWGRTERSERASGARSAKLVTGDLDGNAMVDLIAGGADGYFHRFEFGGLQYSSSPEWVSAYPIGIDEARLAWYAPGIDSVEVYGATGMEDFGLDTTVAGVSTITTQIENSRGFFLRGWINGTRTSASTIMVVAGREPATIVGWSVLDSKSISVLFSYAVRVDEATVDSIRLTTDAGTVHPRTAIASDGGKGLSIRFESPIRSGVLAWAGLRATDGAPIQSGSQTISIPEFQQAFHVSSWEIVGQENVRVHFTRPVDMSTADVLSNYTLTPFGSVVSVALVPTSEADVSNTIQLTIGGTRAGPTGLNLTLTLTGIESITGDPLANDGNVINLSPAPESLENAYVYPNPADSGRDFVTIGGIPKGARVDVITAAGASIRRMTESTGSGGLRWDLRSDRGEIVGSGVYLIRISLAGETPRLLKAAIIR